MLKVIIATFILSTLAIIAGCLKASSWDNNKDYQSFEEWEEEVWKEKMRRNKDGK